jgi:hypothetical protein
MGKILLLLKGLETFFINLLYVRGFLALGMVRTPKILYNINGESFVL